MEAFEIADVIARARPEAPYVEFLRHPSLSMGVYQLPAGGVDRQQPHGEDEVYYVLSGRGRITVGTEERAVEPGATVFVAAGVEHRFHDFADALTLLVFFAPAEYTRHDQA